MELRDLSHPVESGMPTYPGDPAVEVTPHASFESAGYRSTALQLGSHAGTHVDAPSHTEPDGRSLGEFPVEAFRFDARLAAVDAAPREAIGVDALPEPDGCDLLVVRTGWEAHWGSDRYRDHPYLSRDAAAWCAERGYHVGIDAFSVDPTPSENQRVDEPEGVPAHHELLGNGRLILENLTSLDGLPERFAVHAYPLALDADAAPVRAVAEFE